MKYFFKSSLCNSDNIESTKGGTTRPWNEVSRDAAINATKYIVVFSLEACVNGSDALFACASLNSGDIMVADDSVDMDEIRLTVLYP